MKALARDMSRKHDDVITHISDIHARFEKIHPFADGNGRVGRLLMNAMSLKENIAPAVILQEKRKFYTAYLNKAQMKNELSLLEDFVCDSILEGYSILERR